MPKFAVGSNLFEAEFDTGKDDAMSKVGRRVGAGVLLVAAMALVVWIRTLPLSLGGVAPSARAQLTYSGADGREHVYLGGHDSYYWLRAVRRYLQSGTVCDRIVKGECRDDYARAPVGGLAMYERSLHVASIVWVHRLLTWLNPGYPLPASAFWVSVIVGTLGMVPAFAIGRQLAGNVGGLFAALLIAANPLFLVRSAAGDNDVWNVVLPLFLMWAAARAVGARSVWRQTVYAVVGMLIVGLHAATWKGWIFTYAVVLFGLLAHLAVTLLRAAVRDGRMVWKAPGIRQAAAAFACFCFGPVVLAGLLGADPVGLIQRLGPQEIFYGTRSATGSGATALWPEGFATVSELARPDLKRLATTMGGVPYFFVGWLGLLLLLLPRRRWHWAHFAVLIGGNYLYAYLVTRPNPGRPLLMAMLALPLAVAMLVSVVSDDPPDETERGTAFLVIGWFLAALLLAFDGLRFAMLLVPAFGIVFGVAMGRLYEWLTRLAARLPLPLPRSATALPFLLVCVALYPPVHRAYGVATAYAPRMNDAWWDTLVKIRDETPAETIVSTWWPYGYWVEYAADRRTTADGGSLPTRVPYWLARALFASDEDEAVGLLRMLDCKSDVPHADTDDRGAFYRIVRRQVDGITAQAMVVEIARRSREDAEAYLRTQGIRGLAQRPILEATHCQAPPAVLILTSEMIHTRGWKFMGNWNFRNAYLARHLRRRPENEAVGEIVQRFRTSEKEARALYQGATGLDTEAARDRFASPPESYLTTAWVPCNATAAEQELVCEVKFPVRGGVLEAFAYPREEPSQGRFRWSRAADAVRNAGAPAEIIVATSERTESFAFSDPIDPRLGVLVDVPNDRILVGTPGVLRSTFTHLMFLDGRYARHFRKFDDRRGYGGERVVTWTVDWEAAQEMGAGGRVSGIGG